MSEARDITLELMEGVTETLLATPLGNDQYRLEESSVLGEPPRYHDIIQVEPSSNGAFRLLRIVSSSGLSFASCLVSESFFQSAPVATLLDKLVRQGGTWEKVFGGILMLHIPPLQKDAFLNDFNAQAGNSSDDNLARTDRATPLR